MEIAGSEKGSEAGEDERNCQVDVALIERVVEEVVDSGRDEAGGNGERVEVGVGKTQ
jgi:hypothetical protein